MEENDQSGIPTLGDNRQWLDVQIGEDGQLIHSAVEDDKYLKLRQNLRDRLGVGRSIRRGLIRYLYLIIDCSRSMSKKDDALKPSAFECCKRFGEEFINQYFDQNPISQLGLIITRNSQAKRVTELTTNPKSHIEKLKTIDHEPITDDTTTTSGRKYETKSSYSGIKSTSTEDIIHAPKERGEASLQHSIELGISSLQYIPEYGSRELLIIYSSLSSTDPGDIFNTIEMCKKSRVRVSIISLSAEVYICKKICEETGGTYSIIMDSTHFKDCFLSSVIPPPELNTEGTENNKSKYMDMVLMGFPTRVIEKAKEPALFTWDMNNLVLSRVAFKCPRCRSRVLDLPTDCSLCNLPLIFSSHIARSYHHLFPIEPYEDYATLQKKLQIKENPESSLLNHDDEEDKDIEPESKKAKLAIKENDHDSVTTKWKNTTKIKPKRFYCSSCLAPLSLDAAGNPKGSGCKHCHNLYCLDCDLYIHDSLYNCPGCT